MNREEFFEIAGKILAGEASDDEKARVQRMIESSEMYCYDFEIIKDTWLHARMVSDVPGKAEVFTSILAEIDEQNEKELSGQNYVHPRTPNGIKSIVLNKFALYAAALLVLISVALVVLESVTVDKVVDHREISLITKTNASGQKSQIHLPDGTNVWLNSESTIIYPEVFEGDTRTVKVIGEAYFEIHKNEQKPFIVTTGIVNTTALGTAFNVKAFSLEKEIVISLIEGKVRIDIDNDSGQVITLSPGQSLDFQKDSNQYETVDFDILEVIGWKDGIIYFKSSNVHEVIEKLSRWYGVEFLVTGTPPAWSYTGRFKNAYLENVLNSIAFTKGFDFELKQKEVIMKFN